MQVVADFETNEIVIRLTNTPENMLEAHDFVAERFIKNVADAAVQSEQDSE